ncbi:MAG: YbhB/YbcL family Raf kinase inhibitor-like protein [Microcystaceae cyanobacterium]
MKLTSSAFEHQGKIPSKHTCDGENINPPLTISDIPTQAKSLVLIMDDPDVPKRLRQDGMWDHWIVFNLPASLTEIKEGEEPIGTHGIGTSGSLGYYGPCPPDREHRYFFKLYALDTKLALPEKATKQQIETVMEGHILEKTELMGRYERT